MFCLLTVTAPAAALAGTPGSEDHAARLLTAEAALASGSHSFNAFFNAGSAALKLGRPGEAIFWYERARLLYDGDPRLDAYLDAARRFSGADRYLSPVHPAVQVLFFFHYRMSRAVLIRVLVAGVAVLLVLAGFGIWLRLGRALWFRISVSVFLCALLGGSLSLVLRSRALFDPSRAVIIEAERPLASGPDPADPVLAALPAGIEVSILGNGGRMVKVMLPSGAIGYFPANALRRITGGHAPGA